MNRIVVMSLALGLAIGCADSARQSPAATVSPVPTVPVSLVPTVPASPSPPPTTPVPTDSIRDVMGFNPFAPLVRGAYFIDPDGDRSTTTRVVYEVPADGWSMWIGAAKFSDAGHVGLSITTVANLVTHGCTDHSWADPPIGPTVDDLAVALTELEPFEVTAPPTDVTLAGYSGTHLEWKVPDLPITGSPDQSSFTGCAEGTLKSWVAFIDEDEPGDAFYGYTGPGYTEEFWILDVDGVRLMIAAERSAGSPAGDLAELQTMLDSIVIES